MLTCRFGICCLLVFTLAGAARAETISVSLDRWMYPFAFTGGTRNLAPTFGAVGTPGFDNRDAQFLIGFDTSSTVPIGLGAGSYQINSVIVRAMAGTPAGFAYDPTYDSYRTYLPSGDAQFVSDTDAGRPIELHGIGFRNGYTRLSFGANDNQPPGFEESSPFGAQEAGTRNAYALGFSGGTAIDVSNNIDDGIESNPWAIGTAALAASAAVPDNTTFSFAIDTANADVRDYLQRGLNEGFLGFAITSMHEASQAGGIPTPQFVTRENSGAGSVAGVLEIDLQVVPEPATAGLMTLGALLAPLFMALGRRRARHA